MAAVSTQAIAEVNKTCLVFNNKELGMKKLNKFLLERETTAAEPLKAVADKLNEQCS